MKTRETLIVVAAILRRGDRVLLSRRPAGGHLAGLWEFPGGKVEAGETPDHAIARELGEELGIVSLQPRPYRAVYHEYPERRVLLLTFEAAIDADPPPGPTPWRWVSVAELDPGEMPEADEILVQSLQKEPR